ATNSSWETASRKSEVNVASYSVSVTSPRLRASAIQSRRVSSGLRAAVVAGAEEAPVVAGGVSAVSVVGDPAPRQAERTTATSKAVYLRISTPGLMRPDS